MGKKGEEGRRAKRISKQVEAVHEDSQASAIFLKDESPVIPDIEEALVPTSHPYKIGSKQIHAKKVRGMLFSERNTGPTKDDRGVLWSSFDEEEGVTYGGLGFILPLEEAKKFAETLNTVAVPLVGPGGQVDDDPTPEGAD